MIITPRPLANVLLARRLVTTIDAPELRAELDREGDELRVFDVRAATEFERGTVPGATRLDARRPKNRRLRRDRVNVLYGADAHADEPYLAAWELADAGFPVVVLEGGYVAWRKECGEESVPELPALFAVLRMEGVCV